MKIAIGSNHDAYYLKEEIVVQVESLGHSVTDFGCHSCEAVDYPDISFEVAQAVIEERVDRGILLCETGIGVAIAAGKIPGIRAALCHDTYSAERAQLSNNAQILTMGAKVIGPEAAKKVVESYLSAAWEGGSTRKNQKIIDKEQEYLSKSS